MPADLENSSDEAVEAAARAMALVDEENGCFERVDEFDAITDPFEAEDYLQAHGYPNDDRDDCEYWRRRAKAAVAIIEPLIAARVRAEAVADERQRIKATVWTERGLLADRERTLAVLNRIIDGAAGSVPVATPRLTDVIAAALCAQEEAADEDAGTWRGWSTDDVAELLAGAIGSVPVATPGAHDAGCERAYGQERCACQRRADVEFSHSAAGPVATPTEPPYVDLLAVLHEDDCEHGNMPEVCARCDGASPVPAEPSMADRPTRQTPTARVTLAWLIWCHQQGYGNPADREIVSNWVEDDESQLTAHDVAERQHLLGMADEVLTALRAETEGQP